MIEFVVFSHLVKKPEGALYPDAVALSIHRSQGVLTCVYNDHSLYVWDVKNVPNFAKLRSFLYHSSCIWGIDVSICHSALLLLSS